MLVSCGVGAAAGGSEDTPASTAAEPTATETVTVTETADPEPASGGSGSGAGITDGTYLVGSEIAPGVYESGEAEDGLCYADTATRGGGIMAQEVANQGSVIIRLSRNAYTFKASGCGTWQKVG